jgi:multiple sugar transport system substrate-binding protein
MRVRQSLALAVAVALCALVGLGGCGQKSGESAGGRTEVTFWHFWRQEWITPLIANFERAHPDIHVVDEQLTWQAGQEKIQAAIAAGNAPDLCELGSTWLPRFAASGVLLDLTSVADSLRGEVGHWEAATQNGRVYGLPWVVGTRALFWNRALFRAAGLDTTHAPDTWDELLTAATRLSRLPGVKGFGLNAGERYVLFKKFMPFAWGNGGEILTPDGRHSAFDSPANAAALAFYVQLAKESLIEKQDVNLRVFAEDAPGLQFEVGLIPRPAPDRGRHASFAGGEYLVVFAASKRAAAATELARFLIGKESAVTLCRSARSVQPAAIGAAEEPYYQAEHKDRLFVEQLATAVAPPPHPRWGEMEEVLDQAIEAALYGKKTPAAAVHDAGAGLEALLAEGSNP